MTAEEFLQESAISHFYDEQTDRMVCFDTDIKIAMVEFAKYHVKKALEAACNKARVGTVGRSDGYEFWETEEIDKQSILSAYDLNKILND